MNEIIVDSERYSDSPNITEEVFDDVQYVTPRRYNNISRYANVYRIRDNETNEIYHSNLLRYNVPVSSKDNWVAVNADNQGRLDELADKYYQDPSLWWLIAIASGLEDAFSVPFGWPLRIPPKTVLYGDNSIIAIK